VVEGGSVSVPAARCGGGSSGASVAQGGGPPLLANNNHKPPGVVVAAAGSDFMTVNETCAFSLAYALPACLIGTKG